MFRRASAALAIAAVLTGCEGPTQKPQGADGGTLVIAAPVEAETLLPPLVMSTAAKQVVDQMFEHLADAPPDLNTVGSDGYIPRAADTWVWSSDSTAVTFRLSPKGRFHDGHPVRSAEFKQRLQLSWIAAS